MSYRWLIVGIAAIVVGFVIGWWCLLGPTGTRVAVALSMLIAVASTIKYHFVMRDYWRKRRRPLK